MKFFRQLSTLMKLSIGSWQSRKGSLLVSIIGVMCVVGVLVAMLSMGTGVSSQMERNVRADRALVFSKGAAARAASSMERSQAATIAELPGVKRDADGKALATANYDNFMYGNRRSDNTRTAFPLRGVDPQFFKVYPEVRLTAGRWFTPGLNEIIVGKSRHEQFVGLEIGDIARVRGVEWTVVGHFDPGGGEFSDSVLADLDTMLSVFKRNDVKTMTLVLESPSVFADFKSKLENDPSLKAELKTEKEVLQQSGKQLNTILNFVSYFVGSVMAIGATLGSINVMYAWVDGCKREMATLRAIGFGNMAVVLSILLESLLIALPGALLGVLSAWLFFNGNAVSPLGVSFNLAVTPALAALGISWALCMGLIGGLFPAIRAARLPVATAIRAV